MLSNYNGAVLLIINPQLIKAEINKTDICSFEQNLLSAEAQKICQQQREEESRKYQKELKAWQDYQQQQDLLAAKTFKDCQNDPNINNYEFVQCIIRATTILREVLERTQQKNNHELATRRR